MTNRLGYIPEFKGDDTPDSTISKDKYIPRYSGKEDNSSYSRLGDTGGYSASDFGGDVLATTQASLRGTQEPIQGALEIISPTLAKGYTDLRSSVQNTVKDITNLSPFTKEDTNAHKSEQLKQQISNVQQAEGFTGTVKELVKNPGAVASYVGESTLPMVAGGLGAGLLKAGGLSAGLAAGIGEGAISAGSQAYQSSQDGALSTKEKVAALGTGLLVGATGVVGNKIANKFDAINPEALFTGKITKIVDSVPASSLKSGAIEGGEELVQSGIETILANIANGLPPFQGLGEQAAIGLVTGNAMGLGSGFAFSKKGVAIDPNTNEEFQNKKVSESAKKLSNLEKLKATQVREGVDTAEIDSRIDKARQNILDSRKVSKDADGKETLDNTDYNDEVDSLIKHHDDLREQENSSKDLADSANTYVNLIHRFKQNGFTEEQATVLSSNLMEDYSYSKNRQDFLDNFDFLVDDESRKANNPNIDYFGANNGDTTTQDTTQEPAFTQKDPNAPETTTKDSTLNDLMEDPATATEASDIQAEVDLQNRLGTVTSEDEAMLAEDIFGDTTPNELTEEEVDSLAARSEAQVQKDIYSDNTAVAINALDQKNTNNTIDRTESIAETTKSDSSQEELIADVKDQVSRVKKIKEKNEYGNLKTNKARADYHFNNKNGLVSQLRSLNEEYAGEFDSLIKSTHTLEVLASKPRVSAKDLSTAIEAIEADISFINEINYRVTTTKNPQTLTSATIATTEEVNVKNIEDNVTTLQEAPAKVKDDVDAIVAELPDLKEVVLASTNGQLKPKKKGLKKKVTEKVPDLQTALENSQGLETQTKIAIEKATRKAIKKKLPATIKESVEDIGTVETLRELADQEDALYEDIDISDALRGKKLREIRNKIQMLRQADPVTLPEDTTPQALETDEYVNNVEVGDSSSNSLSDYIDLSIISVKGASKIKGAIGAQQEAIRMTQDGVAPLQIWKMTNWFYDTKSGDWKFEISDADMSAVLFENGQPKYDRMVPNSPYNLGSIIQHDILFKSYPELARYKVIKDPDMKARGKLSPMDKTITLSSDKLTPAALDTLIHEIQHYIQAVENFSRGGAPSQFTKSIISEYVTGNIDAFGSKIAELEEAKSVVLGKSSPSNSTIDKLSKNPLEVIDSNISSYNKRLDRYTEVLVEMQDVDTKISDKMYGKMATTMYLNLLGEMEARDTAYRRLMNDQQRKTTIPMSSVPLPLSQQITYTPKNGVAFSIEEEGKPEVVESSDAKLAFDHIVGRLNTKGLGLTQEDGSVLDFKIKLVTDKNPLPSHISPKGEIVKGAFDRKNNTVYIVPNAHGSVKEVVQTMAHELVGHVGLRKVLGGSVDNLYHRMLTSDQGLLNDIVKTVPHYSIYMEQWSKNNSLKDLKPSEIYKTGDVNGNSISIPKDVAMRLADEYMAILAEKEVFYGGFIRNRVGKNDATRSSKSKKRSKLIQSFVGKINHQLRKVFGMTSEHLTKDDLLNILAESTNHVFTRTAFDYSLLVSNKDATSLDSAVQASIVARNAVLRMNGDVGLVSKTMGVMLEGGYGRLNDTWLTKQADLMGRHIQKNKFLSKFFALGALNHQKHLGIIQSQAAGAMVEMRDFSTKFGKISRGMKPKAMSELMLYFITKDAILPSDPFLSNPKKEAEFRAMIPKAKAAIIDLGEQMVGLGILDSETYLENKDSYLPTRYVKYLVTYKGSKTKPSFQDYLKQKNEDLTDMDKARLGEIKDPGFLVAEAIGVMSRDVVLNQMYNSIYAVSTDHSLKWILGSEGDVVDSQGARVNIGELRKTIAHQKELVDIHNNAEITGALNYTTETYDIIKGELDDNLRALDEYNERAKLDVVRMVKKFNNIDNPTQEEIDSFINAEYKRMPDSKRYGSMAGQLVRKEIFDSLITVDEVFAEVNDLKLNGTLVKTHALFKFFKVAANPTSYFRNGMTNGVMLDMSTNTNFIKLNKMLFDTAQAVVNRGLHGKTNRWLDMAIKNGLQSTTMSSQELNHLQKGIKNSINSKEATNKAGQIFPALNSKFLDFVDFTSKAFGLQELLFKTVAMRDHIEIWESQNNTKIDDLELHHREAVIAEAVNHANRSLLDYSKVNTTVGALRRLPLGAPFLTFMYKSFPVMIENFMKRPWKMGGYMALPTLAALMVQSGEGWDEDDFEEFKAKLPLYSRDNSSNFVLPFKFGRKNLQIVDMEYIYPAAPYMSAVLKMMNTGSYSSVADSMWSTLSTTGAVTSDTYGFLGGPVPNMIVALMANKRVFGGKPVWTEGAPASTKVAELAQYTAEMMLPPWATSQGIINKMSKSLHGYKTYDLRGTQQSVGQAALSFTGISLSDADPKAGQDYNAFILSKEYRNLKTANRKAMIEASRRGYSPEEKASVMRDYKVAKSLIDKRVDDYNKSIGR